MRILRKIKQKGIIYYLKIGKLHAADYANKVLYYFFCFFPLNENRIIFESEGDFSDNAQALYQYMKDNNYLKKYRAVWLADDSKTLQDREQVIAVNKGYGQVSFKTSYYLATSKYYIYDHNNLLEKLRKRNNQRIVYLSHGFGFKSSKGYDKSKAVSIFDEMIVTGEIPAVGNSRFWSVDIDKTRMLGYSRLDYFFTDLKKVRKILNSKYALNRFDKIILWMPTFRQSVNESLSENYIVNETGLPLFNSENSLYDFNDFLKVENVLFVLKIHHLQASLPVFRNSYSNILILRDKELANLKVQLYQFVALTDALITDYSSISVDYLLLDKPIVYTLDDYEQYNKSRGVWPENAIDYMAGYHVYNVEELGRAVAEICHGVDCYKKSRSNIIGNFHKYVDGNSSKRIIEYLEL